MAAQAMPRHKHAQEIEHQVHTPPVHIRRSGDPGLSLSGRGASQGASLYDKPFELPWAGVCVPTHFIAASIWTIVFAVLSAYDPKRILRAVDEIQTVILAIANLKACPWVMRQSTDVGQLRPRASEENDPRGSSFSLDDRADTRIIDHNSREQQRNRNIATTGYAPLRTPASAILAPPPWGNALARPRVPL